MVVAIGYSAIRAGVDVGVVTLGNLTNPTRMYTRQATRKMARILLVTCSGSLSWVEAGNYINRMWRLAEVFGLLFDEVSEGAEIKCA